MTILSGHSYTADKRKSDRPTVSVSSSNIFIFAGVDPEVLSPADTILVT